MFKALTPIIGIIIAVGLFFTYVQPTFKDVKGIQDETTEYTQATEKAAELQQRINELKQQQSSISLANLERLEAILPNRIDEVAVLLDLDALAKTRHLILANIKVGDKTTTATAATKPQTQAAEAPGSANTAPPVDQAATFRNQYTTLDLTFSVAGTYDDFRLFLADIERSLVLMEVTKITFAKSEGDAVPFLVSARLYALTPSTS